MDGKNITMAAVAAILMACAPAEKGRKPASAPQPENVAVDGGSIPEAIRAMNEAGNRAARKGDWETAGARWRVILASKPEVAWVMEEAEWGVAFSDAMHSSLSQTAKKKLRDLHESYAREMGHKEINRQVADLLEEVQDGELRLEIKKVANHAWERDRRLGRFTADEFTPGVAAAAPEKPGASAAKPDAGTAPPVTETSLPAGVVSPQTTGTNQLTEPAPGSPTPAPSTFAPEALPPLGPDVESIHAATDSLISQGKYLPALQSLENADARADQDWIQRKKLQIGDRFCEEKRNTAVGAFKDFKKASANAAKRAHLKRTAIELDSCLAYFPDIPVSPKVRRNRDMVEAELKKLGE